MNLLDFFKQSLFSQKKPASSITVKNYISDVKHFIAWLEAYFKIDFDPKLITEDTLELYKNAHLNIFSSSSLDRHLSSLRKFFIFLTENNFIEKNPFTKPVTTKALDLWKIKEFKDFLYRENASAHTIKNYIKDIEGIRNWYAQTLGKGIAETPNTISHELIQEYKTRLLYVAKLSPKSINRKLSAIRRYIEFTQNIIDPQRIAIQNVTAMPTVIEKKQTSFNEVNPNPTVPAKKRSLFNFLNPIFIESLIAYKIAQGIKSLQSKNNSKANILSNIKKEFYAPDSLSIKSFPAHKKLYHHIRYTRPEWYKKYHNQSFAHYLNASLLIIYSAIIGLMLYQNLFEDKRPSFAAPNQTLKVYSFQGRLTDNSDEPIATSKLVRFMLYTSSTASSSARLWEETRTISPDSDGIFSVLLGSNSTGGNASLCNGSSPSSTPATTACGIPDNLFRDNSQVFLGISIEQDSELTPRQQIATVAYSTNSLFLQGLPPITQSDAGTTNVVLALDSSGNLTIGGSANPIFQATGGQLTLAGETLTLTTNTDSNGDIQLIPDGNGRIDLQKPIVNTGIFGALSPGGVEIHDNFAILATESAVAAFVVNNNTTGGDIFTASSSGTTQFTIANDGTTTITGSVLPKTTSSADLGSASLRWNNLFTNTINTASINTSGQGVFNYNPASTDFAESSVFINPTTADSNDTLLGIGIAGTQKAGIDAEGDLVLGYSSATAPLVSNPFNVYNHGTSLVASIDTSGNASISGTLKLSASPTIQSTANQTLTLGGDTTGNITLAPLNGAAGAYVAPSTNGAVDLGTSSLQFRNVYANNFISPLTGISGYWQRAAGAISPTNITDSLNLGATATSSATVHLAGTAGENSFINTGNFGIGTTSPLAGFENARNGSASTPSSLISGTWFTGGSATTTKPQLLIQPTGTTSTNWSTSGTGFGINATSGFTGNLLDLQIAGINKVYLPANAGLNITNATTNGTPGTATTITTGDPSTKGLIVKATDGTITLTNGLAAYWKFDEGSGTLVDDSVGVNDGLTHGGSAWTGSGKINSAGSFDGSTNYTTAGNNASINFTDAITISTWIYPTAAGDATQLSAIIQKGTATTATSDPYALMFRSDRKVRFLIQGTSGAIKDLTSNSALSLNTWYHVVAIYDSNTGAVNMYINGSLDSSDIVTTGQNLNVVPANLYIGALQFGSNPYRYFTGRIDEMGLWSRALTPDEIALLYNSGAGSQYDFGVPPQTANLTEWQNSDGTAMVVVGPTGNVGIGVSAPAEKLTLASTYVLGWDNGSGSVDVALSRGAANRLDLASGDSLNIVNGNILLPTNGSRIGADTSMNFLSFGASSGNLDFNASGQDIRFNLDTDNDSTTTALRIYTNAINGGGTEIFTFNESGLLALPLTGSSAGLLIGGDTQIYRSSANVLAVAAGDTFQVLGGTLNAGVEDSTSSVLNLFAGATTGSTLRMYLAGNADTNFDYYSFITSDGDQTLYLNAGNDRAMSWTQTANTVSRFNVTGGATGNGPLLSAAGSETDIDLRFTPKGAGDSIFTTGQLEVSETGIGGGLLLGGDTQIYRSAANTLTLGSGDVLTTAVDNQSAITLGTPAGSGSVGLTMATGSKSYFWNIPGTSHTAANLLQLVAGSYSAGVAGSPIITIEGDVGRVNFPTTGSGAGIVIGGDTQIYRSAANILTIPDSVILSGASTTFKIASGDGAGTPVFYTLASGDSWDAFYITNRGAMSWGSGSGAADTNLYRSAANTLKTDDNLFVVGTLTTSSTVSVGGDVTPGSATVLSTTLTTVDSTASENVGYYNSIYCVATDDCKIAYQNNTNGDLKMIDCDDATCATKTTTTVDSTTVNQHISMYCLSSTDCKIAYFDATNAQLMMVDCDDATCATNTKTVVDTVTSANTGQITSIYCVSSTDCKIAYQDATNTNLMMADCDNATCSSRTLTTVDAVTATATGEYKTSIYCASSTDCKIAYNAGGAANDLMMADCDDATCATKTLTTVDSTNSTGIYVSISCPTATDCKISYQDATNADLKMADCDNATCSSKTLTTVDSATDTGYYTSIYCTSSTDCKIAYYENTDDDLMIADCDDATCATKTITTVDSTTSTDTGDYPSIYCVSSTDCKISYLNDGSTFDQLMMADCDTTDCTENVSGYNLGSSVLPFESIYAGSYYGKNTTISSFDLAEEYYSTDALEAGDIVSAYTGIDEGNNNRVSRSSSSYDTKILGIVSTEPGITLADWQNDRTNMYPIALAGRVPVKVSTENGPIQRGDPITSSSIPGIGMRATKPGNIIGVALTSYNGEGVGAATVFVNTRWNDPNIYISDTGDLSIQLLASEITPKYQVSNALNQTIDRIGVFAELVVGNFRAGVINAQQIITGSVTASIANITTLSTDTLAVATTSVTIGGQSIQEFILATVRDAGFLPMNEIIVSPLASIDQINTNIISPLGSETIAITGNIEVKNAQNETVAQIDTTGDATFSGQITSEEIQTTTATVSGTLAAETVQTNSIQTSNLTTTDATISGTLRAGRILADDIEGLNARIATLAANTITNYGTASAELISSIPQAQLDLGFIDISTFSASFGTFREGLMALGPSTFGQITAIDSISVGTNLAITNNSINLLGEDLQIQPLRQGGVSFLAGLVRIDTNGNLTVGGNADFAKDVAVHGALSANIISPLPNQDVAISLENNGAVSNFKIQGASNSAVLAIDSTGDLVSSGSGTFNKLKLSFAEPAYALDTTTSVATGSAGTAILKSTKKELTINNPLVTENSLIYITPVGNATNQVLYLLRQVAESNIDTGSFTVGIAVPTLQDIQFNWIIVN